MIYIENNVINLTRGDDATLSVSLSTDEGNAYEMSENEYLNFSVRVTPEETSELLLEIKSAPGTDKIVFDHADTAELEIGYYSAEIQLMTEEGKRVTVWPKLTGSSKTSKANRKNFCLMSEVVLE